MRKRLHLIMVIGAVLFQFASAEQDSPAVVKSLDLYLLIGQSNMAGRGTVEPQDLEAHPRVLSLNKENQWIPAVDPIHFDKSIAGVGPGRTFGLTLAEHAPTARIGLNLDSKVATGRRRR
ncbi:sialate O-acetylesterase [Planctomycetota bacterium]